MIKISHESPLCLLEESLKYNDYQYILPFFWERFPKYKEFMLNYRKQKDSFIILDNGLFEGEVPTHQELINMVYKIKPNIFIAPDEWNDIDKTHVQAKYWMGLKNSGVLPEETELMVVLQGNTFSELGRLYQQCIDLGYTHFALNHSSVAYDNIFGENFEQYNNALARKTSGRLQLVEWLIEKNILKEHHYIHLLGCSLPIEFAYYTKKQAKYINSLDTSNPVIAGILEHKYISHLGLLDKPVQKMENFFDKDLEVEQISIILDNIKKFKIIVNE